MINFAPVLSIPQDASQSAFPREKMGGVPDGLKLEDWPKCSGCGGSQTFIAQFKHHPERLDLGRNGRVLFVFQCGQDPGVCETWKHDTGENACFVVEPENLSTPEPNASPPPKTGWMKKLFGTEVKLENAPRDIPTPYNEVIITKWNMYDDGLDNKLKASFFDEDLHSKLPHDIWENLNSTTHLGGVPMWLQSSDEAPQLNWDFVGQISDVYSFKSPPSRLPKWIYEDTERFEGRTHYAVGPNFGGGIAYLFIQTNSNWVPRAKMFWQC